MLAGIPGLWYSWGLRVTDDLRPCEAKWVQLPMSSGAGKITGPSFRICRYTGLFTIMVTKSPNSRKKPVSQKRVAMVLASLVGMMTAGAGTLLVLEGGALGTAMPGWAINAPAVSALVEPAVPLQGQAWNFIIVYNSGDVSASAGTLAEGRLTGGPSATTVRPKANFHFVIDSANSGTMDGALEVGTSWQQQVPGAPHADWPEPRSYSFGAYTNAVGICVVAGSHRTPSAAQHQTLRQLVHELQTRCPQAKVMFQWELDPEAHATAEEKAYAQSFRAAL
jgi:hypothetical protein